MAESDNPIFSQLPDGAIRQIASSLAPHTQPWQDIDQFEQDFLWQVCVIIAKSNHIKLIKPHEWQQVTNLNDLLKKLSETSGFRLRPVSLTGRWWDYDNGPLLAFYQDQKKPCALIPKNAGGYNLFDPEQRITIEINDDNAKNLNIFAYSFYRPLPKEPLNWYKLLRFGLQGVGRDIKRTIMLQLFTALLGLFIPIATGVIMEQIIPNADGSGLLQFTFGLLSAIFAMSLFNIAESISIMRLELKLNVATQAGLWDRLLAAPAAFFRRYDAGDLAFRTSSIDRIQQVLTTAFLQAFLGGIFSILILALLFYYDVFLALSACLIVFIFGLVYFFALFYELKFQRKLLKIQTQLSGFILQVLNNISKLRVSHSESNAFTLWAEKFSKNTKYFFQAENIAVNFTVFQSVFSVLGILVVFAVVMTRKDSLTFGSFIAFNAAYGQFIAAVLGLMNAVIQSIQIIPLYERTKPVLAQVPENYQANLDPGKLTGQIEVQQINFSYEKSDTPIFKNLSLEIKPGMSVAIVGPSGSGKSTLLRLLLGFEHPESGRLLYNGRDLALLNIQSVRSQLGVVLQQSALLPSTIYENIAGGTDLTLEAVWEALEQTAIAEEVRAMPMGVHTLVTELGKTLSMGQRQRLLLARALARKPRILILDEAISALDNITQAIVLGNLAKLELTQIIVTHRLHTIRNVDHVFVIAQGKVVQSGKYETLINKKGLFRELAERQLV